MHAAAALDDLVGDDDLDALDGVVRGTGDHGVVKVGFRWRPAPMTR